MAIACTLLLSACVLESSKLTITRVVDGDTFELSDGRRVRLIGIDTPEKYYSEKLERDAERTGQDIEVIRELGRAASRYAQKLVEDAYVELEYDPANAASDHEDRYGRALAYVWVIADGRRRFCVNERLVADGYATAYTRYPFKYSELYLRLQREAREQGRGLWDEGLEAAHRLLQSLFFMDAKMRQGISTLNMVPSPTALSTEIVP